MQATPRGMACSNLNPITVCQIASARHLPREYQSGQNGLKRNSGGLADGKAHGGHGQVEGTPGQLRIFISYRRSDSQAAARQLASAHTARLGDANVVLDTNSQARGM